MTRAAVAVESLFPLVAAAVVCCVCRWPSLVLRTALEGRMTRRRTGEHSHAANRREAEGGATNRAHTTSTLTLSLMTPEWGQSGRSARTSGEGVSDAQRRGKEEQRRAAEVEQSRRRTARHTRSSMEQPDQASERAQAAWRSAAIEARRGARGEGSAGQPARHVHTHGAALIKRMRASGSLCA